MHEYCVDTYIKHLDLGDFISERVQVHQMLGLHVVTDALGAAFLVMQRLVALEAPNADRIVRGPCFLALGELARRRNELRELPVFVFAHVALTEKRRHGAWWERPERRDGRRRQERRGRGGRRREWSVVRDGGRRRWARAAVQEHCPLGLRVHCRVHALKGGMSRVSLLNSMQNACMLLFID